MNESDTSRGVTKDQWLAAAIDELEVGSVEQITIHGLARKLGISKSGFYWHFKSRQDLLREVLAYWVHELTEVVVDNPELAALPPIERLRTTAQMIVDYDLTRYEIGIRQWAMQDREAARAVRKVNKLRLDFVRTVLEELGFQGDELEMRARTFVCFYSWESRMFAEFSKKNRRALIDRRIEMLCRK